MEHREKGAQAEGRTILFVDESGFYLLPGVVRTWAPRGQTPLLWSPLSRDHLSTIGALSTEGRLLTWTHAESINGSRAVAFLQHLLRQVKGKVLVVWDGATIHRCRAVKQFLSEGAAQRLQLLPLPGYAPELNPIEGVWRWLKRVALANVCCDDLDQLRYELKLALAKLRYRPQVLRGCLNRVGYL
jgi:transposase